MTVPRVDTAMVTADSVARFAALLADRSRIAMCLAMLDGRAWTAGELASVADIGRSTASEHLTLLVSEGLLTEERQGRHRYLRLAGPEIAQVLEDLAAFAGEAQRPNSLRKVRAAGELAFARTCYDHLAGRLGVGLFDALVSRKLLSLDDGLSLTAAGREWFTDFADAAAVQLQGSRPLLRTCLDWTERRSHLGGSLGAALHHQLRQRGWVAAAPQHRAVTVTPAGLAGLHGVLGLDL